MGKIPVMALTATADKLTRDDIARQLSLVNPYIYISSFDRPNLSLRVMPAPPKSKKVAYITRLIDRYPDDSGIVYTLSRKGAETINAELQLKGYKSTVYHAGLSAAERDRAQEMFINGEVQAVCATVAFGMGIDKSNIRWVVHSNMPRNIESYYQEIGRAGRDGLKAETTLFYSYADVAHTPKLYRRVGTTGDKLRETEAHDRLLRESDMPPTNAVELFQRSGLTTTAATAMCACHRRSGLTGLYRTNGTKRHHPHQRKSRETDNNRHSPWIGTCPN